MSIKTNNIKAMVATLVAQAIGSSVLADAQASETIRESVSHLKTKTAKGKKSKRVEDVRIELTQAMFDGRMKLPARMFTKGTTVLIDGHKIKQQEHDQGRSSKFDPEIFGLDANVGDVLVFTHEGGREWSVEKERGSRKGKAQKVAPKTTTKASKTSAKRGTSRKASRDEDDDEDEDEAPARKSKKTQSKSKAKPAPERATSKAIRDGILRFAEIAIENANTKGFKKNTNIMQTDAMGGGPDARVWFTTAENQKFRSWRKKMGLSLKKSVQLLNAEVFDTEDDD